MVYSTAMRFTWMALSLLLACAGRAYPSIVEIIAGRDATIYNDPTSTPLGNGSGQYFFAGRNGENNNFALRRGLLYRYNLRQRRHNIPRRQQKMLRRLRKS